MPTGLFGIPLKEIITELGEDLRPLGRDPRCRHLLSHDEHGIKIQTYCAIIACMLISLWTGRKPTLRTYEMICFSFCGLATEDELLAPIERLQMQPPDS